MLANAELNSPGVKSLNTDPGNTPQGSTNEEIMLLAFTLPSTVTLCSYSIGFNLFTVSLPFYQNTIVHDLQTLLIFDILTIGFKLLLL